MTIHGEYTLDFEMTGEHLPTDEILARLPSTLPCESWRAGQKVAPERTAKTSGIRISIAKRLGKKAAEEALSVFLLENQGFLERLKALGSPNDEKYVRCIMCVYPDNASYFELTDSVMQALSSSGTSLVVAAWPCVPKDGEQAILPGTDVNEQG